MEIKDILYAALCIPLGVSFAYKSIEAMFFGRTWYWTGLLPLSIISPFFIHWAPGKRSLIKRVQAWWIHVTLGPMFFLCALLFTSLGLDKMGLNGTAAVNTVLTLGQKNTPSAIIYSQEKGYSFPILPRMQKALFKLISTPVPEKKGQSLTGKEAEESQMDTTPSK